ncbi:MAG: hypothetical protein ACRCX2_37755 [Paraclostridium sp.]
MNELLKKYEEVIERLFKAEEWLTNTNYKDWEDIRGTKAYSKRESLLKEAEQLQKDLHLHKVNAIG